MADDPPAFQPDDIDFGPTLRGHQKGDRVFDRFVLQKLLGRGGMGVVWLAHDERLHRDVALKFAPQLIRYDEVAVEELKEETRKGLDLSHPHIVKTYDFLLDEDHAAISMEFIDGESLAAKRAKQPNRIFEVHELETWAAQLLDALHYAHQQVGVIHRDLKPANLMVDRNGAMRITDFGIARSITDAINRATLAIGNSTGTLAYMSPQQADGRKPEISDDIYAFGSTMYELLTSKPPFHSGNIGLQLRHEAPVSLSERRTEFGLTNVAPIPPQWEETLLACLSKDPAQRPSNAREIARRLGLLSNDQSSVSNTSASKPITGTTLSEPQPPSAHGSSGPVSYTTAPPPPPPNGSNSSSTTASSPKKSTTPSSGQDWHFLIWLFLALLLFAMLSLGAAGWWVYKNGIPFLKPTDQPEVVEITTQDSKPKQSSEDPNTTSHTKPTRTEPSPSKSTTPAETKAQTANIKPASTTMQPVEKPETPANTNSVTKPPSQNSSVEPPGKFTTIQEAINRAKSGELITIPDGVYVEQVRLKNGIRLKAQNPGKAIVQADGESSSALLAENVRDVSIEGLVFQHTGSEVEAKRNWPVVYLKSSFIMMINCIVEKGVGDGAIITGSSKVEIRQSEFRNNFSHGLVVESGASPLIIGCKSSKNGGNGIVIRFIGTTATIEDGELNYNGGSGLVVNDDASAKVQGHVIAKENIEAGFAADGEGVSLQMDGVLSAQNLVGISIQNAAAGIIRNAKVLSNKESGVVFDGAHSQSIAEKVVAEQNKGDGLLATGSIGNKVRLLNNESKGNGGYGILIFGEGFKPEITGNLCSGNAHHGIFAAEGCSGSIVTNTITGNHLPGIKVENCPNLEVRDNQLD